MDDRRNSGGRFTMEFEAGDILIVADALSVGSATAMMYGRDGREADARLRELSRRFRELSPLPKTDRSEGYGWLEACRALRSATHYEAFAQPSGSFGSRKESSVVLEVDAVQFAVTDRLPSGEAEACIPRLRDFLAQIAPLDASWLSRFEADIMVREAEGLHRDGALMDAAREAVASALGGIHHAVRSANRTWADAPDGFAAVKAVLAVPSALKDEAREMLEAAAAPDSPSVSP